LATRLGITSGSTTKLVDRLEARNLATRRRDRTDRRSMTLRPTKTAIRLADKEGQLLEALLAPLDATLDRHEQATIASYLGAAITQASNHAPS
jgi:DNA-binding MarR family transcriptional regulator